MNMENYTVLKCPSCGSSVIETKNISAKQSRTECGHCGSLLQLKDLNPTQSGKFPPKWAVSIILISIVVGVLTLYMIQSSNNSNDQTEELGETNSIDPSTIVNITQEKKLFPVVKSTFTVVDVNDSGEDQLINKPVITIINKIKKATQNGGLYWIITIRNDSEQLVHRPGVLVSIFDEQNTRIEEKKSWSKQLVLEPGKQTDLLMYIPDSPKGQFRSEFIGFGKFSTNFISQQESIEVINFLVKPNKNSRSYEIIGEVKNNHQYQVDYIQINAIAKNKEGTTIGLASGYVSQASLTANTQSGFKIKAGTFITGSPSSWSLWASGRKHQDNL